jgi:hypothetical protein
MPAGESNSSVISSAHPCLLISRAQRDQPGQCHGHLTTTGTPAFTEVPVSIGGPSRTRTLDPLIKSQLLYQLS